MLTGYTFLDLARKSKPSSDVNHCSELTVRHLYTASDAISPSDHVDKDLCTSTEDEASMPLYHVLTSKAETPTTEVCNAA